MSPSALQQKAKPVESDNGAKNCLKCKLHLARIAELQNQLNQSSNTFTQTITQLKNSQKARTRVAEMDERFIEQCVRAKVDAENELQSKTHQFAAHTAALKNQAQAKISRLTQQVTQLKQQRSLFEQKLNELSRRANKNKSYYQQTILQSKTQLQNQAQELLKIKAELARTNEQTAGKARQAARADELNERLLEQCNMAKLGADAEIAEKAKAFTYQINRLKADAAKQINTVTAENTKVKKTAQHAMQKASQRIKTLEHAISCLNETASSIQSNGISEELNLYLPAQSKQPTHG